MSSATPAIKAQSLSKIYARPNGNTITAVQNLDLTVEPGQVFGLLGPNGAGKTTTIKMFCGLVRPSSGQIHLNGQEVFHQKKAAMQQIGVILEGARNVYWRLTAMQNLLYFGRLKGTTQQLKERAKQLLTELDLYDRRDDEVRFFSRGMQQKVALAAALMNDPSILLLDEPTLGLDIQAARTIRRLIKQLSEEQGKTIILTTHQLDIAQEVCHQIGIISRGQLITNQPVGQLLSLFREERYEIQLSCSSADPLPGNLCDLLEVTQTEDGRILNGHLSEDNLYEVLEQVRQTGLTLVSVNRVEPNLEEVFVKLVEAA